MISTASDARQRPTRGSRILVARSSECAAVMAVLLYVGACGSSDERRPTGGSSVDAAIHDADSGDRGDAQSDGSIDAGWVDSGDASSDALAITSPPEGYVGAFEPPTIEWLAADGATSYRVEIARGVGVFDDAARIAPPLETSELRWEPPAHSGDDFRLRVTALPDGPVGERDYRVRDFGEAPAAVSAEAICESDTGTGTLTTYALTELSGKLFATRNADGQGVCVHDGETLSYERMLPGYGGRFRPFGITADQEGQRLLVTYFPFLDSCGSSLARLEIIEDPLGDARNQRIATGMESAFAVAFDGRRAHLSGLFGQSCYRENQFCLEFGDPCTNGFAAYSVWDLERSLEVRRSPEEWSAPGLAADAERVYRPAHNDELLLVHDAETGALLFDAEIPAMARGLTVTELGGKSYLFVSGFDSILRVYALRNTPVSSPEDLELLREIPTPDRMWQGGFDGDRLWLPGQETRRIHAWDLVPL